jgi:hypothetical protein
VAKKTQSRVALKPMNKIKAIRQCTVDGLGSQIAVGTEFDVDGVLLDMPTAQRLVDGGSFEFVTIAADAAGE